MTAIDERHVGRSRPVGLDDDQQNSYHARYQNDIVADHLTDEDSKIDAVTASNGAWTTQDPAARLAHASMTDAGKRRPRESLQNNPVGRLHLEGRAWPLTTGRARPSDLDDFDDDTEARS